MEELVMLRLAVEAVVMKMVMEVMERMVMLMAVMAINIAMGVEMAVVMKVGATDNDDGDERGCWGPSWVILGVSLKLSSLS